MRNVVLYIAMSLDGFIAKSDGDVSWLCGDGSDIENLGSYPNFYNSIDTIILGYNTYSQIVNELSRDNWVYNDKLTYVFTTKSLESRENIIFTSQDLVSLVNDLKGKNGQDIWVCGGANIVKQMINLDLIDKLIISIIPTIVGNGIRLFADCKNINLKLIKTYTYNGIVDLVYTKNN